MGSGELAFLLGIGDGDDFLFGSGELLLLPFFLPRSLLSGELLSSLPSGEMFLDLGFIPRSSSLFGDFLFDFDLEGGRPNNLSISDCSSGSDLGDTPLGDTPLGLGIGLFESSLRAELGSSPDLGESVEPSVLVLLLGLGLGISFLFEDFAESPRSASNGSGEGEDFLRSILGEGVFFPVGKPSGLSKDLVRDLGVVSGDSSLRLPRVLGDGDGD